MADACSKTNIDDLALLGGAPLFARGRGTGQLANRDPQGFMALAHGALDRRWLSNQGPLVEELEERLAALHGARFCIAMANACFGLLLALQATAPERRREVILPAMTFRGLPHVIRWAGLEPRYVDVDPVTHTMTSKALADALGPSTAAVMAVDNVNALCDVAALESLANEAGVPLLLDCVYGVGGTYAGGSAVGARGAASVFSLHATKLINGFEGGYVTTQDAELAKALRQSRTFGFGEGGAPVMLGLNAKLNELHAAMALSNLPYLGAIRADNRARFDAYGRVLETVQGLALADYARGPDNHCLVLVEVGDDCPLSREDLMRVMRAEGALARPYYAPPLHSVDPSRDTALSLPVAEAASRRFIQMPAGDQTTLEDIAGIGELLALAVAHAERLSSRKEPA